MQGKLTDHFERVCVINLPHKIERRQRLAAHLEEVGLSRPEDLQWVRAISGKKCPPPNYFKAGEGAWGCLQSHIRIAQDAAMDGLESVLILEDDVVFHERASSHLSRLMREVPKDWDQLYLGGGHLGTPELMEGRPFVFRCKNVQRTHAFALRGKVLRRYLQHITQAPDYIEHGAWHVDHQLGLAHERSAWSTYAPTWWLAGQEGGDSNISGRTNPRHWWHEERFSSGLPFVHFPPTRAWGNWTRLRQHLHFGNRLKADTFEDAGLDACVEDDSKLRAWLERIARQALDHWMLPAISHPAISRERVASVWSSEVLDGEQGGYESLVGYPENGLFPHPLNECKQPEPTWTF